MIILVVGGHDDLILNLTSEAAMALVDQHAQIVSLEVGMNARVDATRSRFDASGLGGQAVSQVSEIAPLYSGLMLGQSLALQGLSMPSPDL